MTKYRRTTRWHDPLPSSAAPELQGARSAGAVRLAVLPLRREPSVDYLLLALGPSRPQDLEISPTLLEALSAVIGVAAHQARLLARVAAVSKRALAEKDELAAEVARAHDTELVAIDPKMRELFGEIHPRVARYDSTVLVTGETGTGKEVVARRIHQLSRRARRPFVTINCGGMPEALVDSMLFGHERGAFTGALQRHRGVFERAHGGMLLLDEIGDTSASTQVKLLRVLQEGEIERVGSRGPIRVDVRIVAATHRDLAQLVERGSFRGDLFYRLNVVPIVLPALRERRGDIPQLTEAILARLARRFGCPMPDITAAVMARLSAYSWPGNVRELENVLERALVTSTGPELVLPEDLAPPRAPAALPAARTTETYRDAQRRCIEDALSATGGRIYGATGAAARLAMKPTTLQSTMKKLGIVSARREPPRS